MRTITHDKQNNLWIGTDDGGLTRFKNGKFNSQKGLTNTRISTSLMDGDGVLWMGTQDGLCRFKNGTFFLFRRSHGLHSESVSQVVEDGQHLWIGSDRGIYRVSKKQLNRLVEGKMKHIDAAVYQPQGDPKVCVGGFQPSAIKAKDGTLYFSTLKGVVKIDPESFNVESSFFQYLWLYILIIILILLLFIPFFLFIRRLKARERGLKQEVEIHTRDLRERNLELQKARESILKSKEMVVVKNRLLEDQSDRLKEMDEIKSRFFANISHEFRTPLTLIMGPLENMIAACPGDIKDKKRTLHMMMRNVQRLLRLIDQLLELSKLDSGRMKLQTAKRNIISFVKGITDSFAMLARKNETDLLYEPAELNINDRETGDVTLYFDHRKMEDVISNLLMNAIKFTPAGGKITVTVQANAAPVQHFPMGHVEISIADTGPGIPVSQLSGIFKRFYQADGSFELQAKGTGIGLALARELVELHHGTIKAKSKEGVGSIFTIRLPMGNQHLSPEEIIDLPLQSITRHNIPLYTTAMNSKAEEEENGCDNGSIVTPDTGGSQDTGHIILVVEDSVDVRSYIRGELEPLYSVVEAPDGTTGIEKARQIIPDLIVSDIMMPGTNGFELCRVLKEDIHTSHIPVILLTAKASEENVIEGLETGADDYVTKPFSSAILKTRIKNLIDLRKHLQQTLNREMQRQPVEMTVSALDQAFIKNLNKVIEGNLSDPEFNVHDMCAKLSMSQPTLYRKIRALSGESPTDFIRSYRLKRASQLLENNFGSVTAVAFEVGFSSRTYFTRCFKEKFHRLPSSFRASREA